MDRYVAMLWDQDAPPLARQADVWTDELQQGSDRWRIVLNAPGLRVLSRIHRGTAPVATRMVGAEGVIIGVLFERGSERSGRVRELDTDAAQRVIASEGDRLIKHYWGNYVAIWRDAESRSVTVIRDPCGAVPCVHTVQQDIRLIFAHAEDVANLANVRFDPDWTFLQAYTLFDYFVTPFTGLAGANELLPGERARFDFRKGVESLNWAWNGASLAVDPTHDSFSQIRDRLRGTAEACAGAWGTEYRSGLISVSGGLDSTVLLNLMRRNSSMTLQALHYLGVGYEEYESRLARTAADAAGVPLIVATQDPENEDYAPLLEAPRTARPKVQTLSVQLDAICEKAAAAVGAEAYFLGQGGDNLFLQRAGAAHAATDHFGAHGLHRETPSVAYHSATQQQRSIWRVFKASLAIRADSSPRDPYAFMQHASWLERRLHSPAAIQQLPASYRIHPWLAETTSLSPGKADHLQVIIALYNYYLGHGRSLRRDVLFPLFSQPVAELVLRTPLHLLAYEGVDRALERAAFSDIIPTAIAKRTAKGGANLLAQRTLARNHGFFRDLILGGELIQQDWLDRRKVEQALTDQAIADGRTSMSLKLLASAEAWLTTWRRSHARRAA